MAAVVPNATLAESAERSIENLFAPYLKPAEGTRKALTELDVRQVSDGLRRMGKDSWSRVPRLYTVLRIVNQVQVIDSFVAQGVSDIWFPFNLKTLPETLRSPSSRFEFLEAQSLVLTKAFDLEREDGKHRHFWKAEDVPMRKIEELGKGGFGYVDRVVSTITHKEYARKLIPRGRTFKKNVEVLKDYERELGHLKKLSHIHIVELVGSYTDPKFVGIIMSPVADYNLKDFLAQRVLPSGARSFLRTFFGCLAAALGYLHDSQIRHKDIKPQNVLVKGHQVFLTDFGISLDWSELGQSTTTGVTIKTPRYCAPEVAEHMPRNSFSDLWSLGCVFLEIWTALKGRTTQALFEYLEGHGSKSARYYLNQDASIAWCKILEAEAALGDNPPFAWIFGLMQPDQNERWTTRKLLDEIKEVNDDPDTPFAFSGLCCIDDDDSAESVISSKRSSQNLEETGASSIGIYHNHKSEQVLVSAAPSAEDLPFTTATQPSSTNLPSTLSSAHSLTQLPIVVHQEASSSVSDAVESLKSTAILGSASTPDDSTKLPEHVGALTNTDESFQTSSSNPGLNYKAASSSRIGIASTPVEHPSIEQDRRDQDASASSIPDKTINPIDQDNEIMPEIAEGGTQKVLEPAVIAVDPIAATFLPEQVANDISSEDRQWVSDNHRIPVTLGPTSQPKTAYTSSIRDGETSDLGTRAPLRSTAAETNRISSELAEAGATVMRTNVEPFRPAARYGSPEHVSDTLVVVPLESTKSSSPWTTSLEHEFEARLNANTVHARAFEPGQNRPTFPDTDDESTIRPLVRNTTTVQTQKSETSLPAFSPNPKLNPTSWWRPAHKGEDEKIISSFNDSAARLAAETKPINWYVQDQEVLPVLSNFQTPGINQKKPSDVTEEVNAESTINENIGTFQGKVAGRDVQNNAPLRRVFSFEKSEAEVPCGVEGRDTSKEARVLPEDKPCTTQHVTAETSTKAANGGQDPARTCGTCHESLTGRFVRALGGTYHLQCFKCSDCDEPVAERFFPVNHENSDQQYPLCEADYFRRLDLLCHDCGKALRGSYVTACNRKYHMEHFTCSECDFVFGAGESYYEHKEGIFCRYHYDFIASKCKGCNMSVLKQFVELSEKERWHPECYMIHKFWNVKLGGYPGGNQDLMKRQSNPAEHERNALELADIAIEEKVYRIWSTLSAFEEGSASCISEMLLHASNHEWIALILSAEKLIYNINFLFSAIDAVNLICVKNNQKELLYTREAKLFCKKIVALLTYSSKALENGLGTGGVAQELLSLVTGIAHYLKLLIRIGLKNSLRLERDLPTLEGLPVFLDTINAASQILDRPGLRPSLADQESDNCQFCKEPIAESCVCFEETRWHRQCFKCSAPSCANDLIPPLAGPIPPLGLARVRKFDMSVRCAWHWRTGDEAGFVAVTLLQQFTFLLSVALARLAAVFDARNKVPASQSTKAEESAVALLALPSSSRPQAIADKPEYIAEPNSRSDFQTITTPEGTMDLEATGEDLTLDDIPRIVATLQRGQLNEKQASYSNRVSLTMKSPNNMHRPSTPVRRKPVGDIDASTSRVNIQELPKEGATVLRTPSPPAAMAVESTSQQNAFTRQKARGTMERKSARVPLLSRLFRS